MPQTFLVAFIAGFVAQLGFFIFLGLAWKTRGEQAFRLLVLKPGYFFLNPILRRREFTSAGRRFLLLALLCWCIVAITAVTMVHTFAPSLT